MADEEQDAREVLGELTQQPVKMPAADKDPLIGLLLDERYQILEFIGAGGWGNVYRGRHLTLGSSIAIKIIHRHLNKHEGSLKRLQQEAILLSRLESPSIVRIMDHGLVPSPYIVMEFCEGESLDLYLKHHGPLKWELALELFMQICQGLSHAHAQGLVHRDLKPSNIILKVEVQTNKLRAKILDFGIARMIEDLNRLTATGEILGSPPYMSPEQWKGQSDHRSDIYSLGCIMYETLCARQAFSAEQSLDYINKHATQTPLSIKLSSPLAFPQGLEDIVFKCLAKTPEARYQSAREIFEDLERLKAGRKLQIHINKELAARRNKLIISSVLALLGLGALFFWQRELILSPWVNHCNQEGDRYLKQAAYSQAIAAYRGSLLACAILPRQNAAILHSLRMLAVCLCYKGRYSEAGLLNTQIDKIVGSPEPACTVLLRRMQNQLYVDPESPVLLDLRQQLLAKAAQSSAGKHSLAYSSALDAAARVLLLQGSLNQALKTEQESLRIAQDLLEPASVPVAERLNHEGDILTASDDLIQAEKAYGLALKIAEHHYWPKEYAAAEKTLLLADFNNGIKRNCLDGAMGTWEKDISDKTQGIQLSFAGDDALGKSKGRSLQLDYDVDSPNQAFDGFWMKLQSANFSEYDTLSFYLKGDEAKGFTRRLKVELKDFANRPACYFVDGITGRWQEFSIPLRKFKMVSDWGKLNEFCLGFEDVISHPRVGRIYLDQVVVSYQNQEESELAALAQLVGAYSGIASVLAQKQDRQDALAYLNKASAICRAHGELDALPVYLRIAALNSQLGDLPKSLEAWQKALACRVEDGSAETPAAELIYSAMAQIYYQEKNYQLAEAFMTKAYKAISEAPEAEGRLKRVLAQMIKVKKALGKENETGEFVERLRRLSESQASARH